MLFLLERKKASGCNVPTSLRNFTIFLETFKDAFHELFRLCQVAVTIPVSSGLVRKKLLCTEADQKLSEKQHDGFQAE